MNIENKLRKKAEEFHQSKLKDIYLRNEKRQYSLQMEGLFYDYSRNFIDHELLEYILDYSKKCGFKEKVEQIFQGEYLNTSENQKVTHVQMRSQENIETGVMKYLKKWTSNIHEGKYKGLTGKEIKNIIHIGIGGSIYGQRFIVDSLLGVYSQKITPYFLVNLDYRKIKDTLKRVNLDESIVIIYSKSFTTEEVLFNGKELIEEYQNQYGKKVLDKHIFGVTANKKKAIEFGIQENNIFEEDIGVGGRFSIGSFKSLTVGIVYGWNVLEDFFLGMQKMDEHYRKTPLKENIPFIKGILSWFYSQYMSISVHHVCVYGEFLKDFIPYVQQIEMESGGKRVYRNGNLMEKRPTKYIIGGIGTESEHTFFQYLFQSDLILSNDFIGVIHSEIEKEEVHSRLMSHYFANIEVLVNGNKEKEEVKKIRGGHPTNGLLLYRLDAYHLGILCALYEHSVFTEGVLMGINSFDQWGVEESKKISKSYLSKILGGDSDKNNQLYNFYMREKKVK